MSFLDKVNTYLEREIGSYLERLPDDGIINLAYTEHEGHKVQVDFDVNELSFKNYLDGRLVLVESRDDLGSAGDEIESCSFDDMIYSCLLQIKD